MSKKLKEEPTQEEKKLKLNILELITESQTQNGLNTGNYMRYRQYCSRRLHRLRVGLGCTHGKKKYLVKEIEVSEMDDERYLMIPLLKSERAWAYATQIKSEGIDRRPEKKHFKKRLNKALHWSEELFNLSKQKADDRTIFEAQAYLGWIKGLVLLESEKWEESIENFIHSK
jgi:signal recognition particle subunit SRP68